MSRPTICIKPQNFNVELLEIKESKFYKTKDTNLTIETSDIMYLNDKSELCDLYLVLPEIETYGPSLIYKLNSKNKSPENVEGYSISYSHPDVEKVFNLINDVCQNKIGKQYTLKPTFNYKNKVENGMKTQDEIRPKVTYFKLVTLKDYKTNETVIPARLENIGNVIHVFIQDNRYDSVPAMNFLKLSNRIMEMNKLFEKYGNGIAENEREISQFNIFKKLRQAVIKFLEELPSDLLESLRNTLFIHGVVIPTYSQRLRAFLVERKQVYVSDLEVVCKCNAALLILDLGIGHISDELLSKLLK